MTTLEILELELAMRLLKNGTLTWTTKEGKKISIKDMSNKHLINTIKMLERQPKSQEWSPYDEIGPGDGDNMW